MSKTSPAKPPGFQQTQHDFAAHIRDPEQNARPKGIEDRRMAIYRELFYNNVEGFVAAAFPVLRSITLDATWHRRIRRFFADHRCRTPYFSQIANEFLDWLTTARGNHQDDPPFIQELAHYEWVELALQISDADRDIPPLDRNGDLLTGIPLTSSLAMHLAYRYPVHRISPEFQPERPGDTPTFLVVYRDRQDDIHFLEINAVTYRLLDLLKENPQRTGQYALKAIAEEMGHGEPEAIRAHGLALLNDLRQRNIIIGTRR